MKVDEIMTQDPMFCTPEAALTETARMMKDFDCGAIPVVENQANRRLRGIITDRDIVIRAIAEGMNPQNTRTDRCMTPSPVTSSPDDSVEDCMLLMEKFQVRRIPVVDDLGSLVGMVVQAHVARNSSKEETGELVKDVLKRNPY